MKTKNHPAPAPGMMNCVHLLQNVFFPLVLFLVVLLFSSSVSALVMGEKGPEPVIVQIKESARLSDQLDDLLGELAYACDQDGLRVVKQWAGSKFLILVSFPEDFNREKALIAMERLEQLPAVEKVVPRSAFNLHFRSGDFKRSYDPNENIPDVARRGLDKDRIGRTPAAVPSQEALDSRPHVPNRLIVSWKEENIWNADATGFDQVMKDLHDSARCSVVREFRFSPTKLTQVLEFENPSELRDKLRIYVESGLVVNAQPDFLYEILSPTNDPWYSSYPGPQWSLPVISAPQAWSMFSPKPAGDSSVIIAVGDSGANVLHPDFSTNMVDSSLHHNFINDSNNVDDDNGHGSAVASIIGAQGGNGYAMTGVAKETSLMILKVVNFEGRAYTSHVLESIMYAADHGATAVNFSLGGFTATCEEDPKWPGHFTCQANDFDEVVKEAARYAQNHNLVMVCAAGNYYGIYAPDGQYLGDNDFDIARLFPASLAMDNVISVLATNQSDVRASYSSYGKYRVDLGAPAGEFGLTRIPSLRQTFHVPATVEDRNLINGTSAAAPHVAGAAALIKSLYPWESYSGIRDRILMGAERPSGNTLNGLCRTNGRLNVYKALQPRSRLQNLSTRARVEGGDKVMIAGFVIGGSASGGPIEVVMRGLGPSVGVLPPTQKLGNPVIELHYPDSHVETNDDWASDFRHNDLEAAGLAPSNSSEAAMIRLLPPGAYTVIVRDAGTAYGIGLVELFALGNSEQSRLQNISTRCLVGTGDNRAIAGTIIGNNSPNLPKPDRRLLIFGKGPSLPIGDGPNGPDALGPVLLANPQIQIAGGEDNDNWYTIDDDSGDQTALEEELNEANFAPTSFAESALWPTFSPGAYTVILSGVNNGTGIGLIEFYEY